MSAAGLDHVGVCAREAGPLHAGFAALGFTLTPLARQSNDRGPLGTGNRCAMLRRGYLEFLAILDPALPDNGLGRMLDRFEGTHILALAIADPAAELARLRGAGLDIGGVAPLSRPCDDPEGRLARFERLPLPDAPEGRLQLIRHLTPELLWQDRFLHHPNGAEALEEAFLVSDAPMESAARLSRLAGLPLRPRPGGGLLLDMPAGAVSVLSPAEAADALPGIAPPPRPALAGFAVRTRDGNAAARRLLPGARELPGGALLVEQAGAAVVFRP